MENNLQSPLAYFENLLERNKIQDLKSDFIYSNREQLDGLIDSVDEEKGIIKYWGLFSDGSTEPIEALTSKSFQAEFINSLNVEYLKTKNSFDAIVVNITMNGKSPEEYLAIQVKWLNTLFSKAQNIYPYTPIVQNTILKLIEYISSKYGVSIENTPEIITMPVISNPDDYSPDSFLLDAQDNESRITILTKLYTLLTSHPVMIEGSKEEFINAFSQKVVINGLKWCVKGKNGQITKSSLLYLIEQLNQGYINEVPDTELNRKVAYVFRGLDGSPLKNIRQSKNAASSNPTGKDKIDQILLEVFQ